MEPGPKTLTVPEAGRVYFDLRGRGPLAVGSSRKSTRNTPPDYGHSLARPAGKVKLFQVLGNCQSPTSRV
jgi:hypothetical protein